MPPRRLSARRVLLRRRRRLPRGARVLWVGVLRLLTILHLLVIRAVAVSLLLLLWLLLLPAPAGMLREALHGYRAAHAALHVWSVSGWCQLVAVFPKPKSELHEEG